MQPENSNKNLHSNKYLHSTMNQYHVKWNVAENEENVSNQTPSRNAKQNDICTNVMKLNGLEGNKDPNPLCNLFCKLPKVTSASAISPERQTHDCHNQSVYEIVQKENLEKKLLLLIFQL